MVRADSWAWPMPEGEMMTTFTIHPIHFRGDAEVSDEYAIVSHDGGLDIGFIVGDTFDVRKLNQLLSTPRLSAPIPDDAPELGTRWLTTSQAVAMAHDFDPDEYPTEGRNTHERLRAAGRRGTIRANRHPAHGWQFQIRSLRGWLENKKG